MNKGKAALTGAATGAAAGAALGPWGAAGGAVIGGAIGYFGAGDDEKAPTYNPNRTNFTFGLGPADYNYAQNQSNKYDQAQGGLQSIATDAYNREAPTQAMPDSIAFQQSGGQGYLTGADAESRQMQMAALGGLQSQTGALNQFANRAEGPSAAQATLQQGVNAAAAQQMALARAQPGGGGAALRQAAFNAGGISAQAGATAAQLRAQETAAYRQQQLAALGQAQTGAAQAAGFTGQIRAGDTGMAQLQAGQSNYDAGALNQFNQGQQQLQYQVGANNLQAAGQARGQNDAMTLGALGQQQSYEVLRNQLAQGTLNSGSAYESARAAGAGLGSQNFNAAQQQNNNETAMMLGAMSGASGYIGQLQAKNQNGFGNGSGNPTSDVRAKEDIKPTSVLAALGGGRYRPEDTRAMYEAQRAYEASAPVAIADAHRRNALYSGGQGFDRGMDEFAPSRSASMAALGGAPPALPQPDIEALDAAYRRQGGEPNLRPAQAYDYRYRSPEQHGEGRFVGPMAQDLEHLPGVVETKPGGEKAINADRLTLANTSAMSELQRRQDELEEQNRLLRLRALGFGGGLPQPDVGALDVAYGRSQAL